MIEARGLVKRYGDKTAVDDLSFDVKPGIVTGFLWENFDIPRSRWIYGLPGVLLAQVLAQAPIAFMLLDGALRAISPSLEEAASTMGAKRFKVFRSVTWPLLKPALAAAFYPGCSNELRSGYQAAAPLLLQVGEDDDWTPPEPCRQLAAQATGAPVTFHAYPGAVHGFDGTAPVIVRRDVPNGVRPGQGVRVGGQVEARDMSRARLAAFLSGERLP